LPGHNVNCFFIPNWVLILIASELPDISYTGEKKIFQADNIFHQFASSPVKINLHHLLRHLHPLRHPHHDNSVGE